MAGIGFELNKILKDKSYSSLFQAYLYAGIIGSGAWLMAVASLAFLGSMLMTLYQAAELNLFFVNISFTYGITLVLTGPLQLVLSRYAADQEYLGKRDRVFPAFVFSIAWLFALLNTIGFVIYIFFVPGSLLFRLSATLLMGIVGCIWISSLFLSALQDFRQILIGFTIGFLSSLCFSYYGAAYHNLGMAMLGFTVGHAILLLWLCVAIYKEAGNSKMAGFEWLNCFRDYWDLALAGFLYNFGIWIDKFLFWWLNPHADHVGGILYAAPLYDRVVYFSLITIVPGISIFLLKLETEFADANRIFFDNVMNKGRLSKLIEAREQMQKALKGSFSLLIKMQGLLTLFLILNAETCITYLNLGATEAGIFRVALLGTFLLVIFMSLLMVLHYLNKRKDAMICCLLFAAINTIVTTLSILGGEQWYGIGFLAACACGLVMAANRVNIHLGRLEYDTFTSQPLYG